MNGYSIHEQLTTIGLTEKESRVYLAALTSGPTTVVALAEETGIKRPTVYVAIKSLTERGLMESRQNGKRTAFVAASPKRIAALLEEERRANATRRKILDTILPELLAFTREMKLETVEIER